MSTDEFQKSEGKEKQQQNVWENRNYYQSLNCCLLVFRTAGESVYSGGTSLAYYEHNHKLKITLRVIISKLTLLVEKFRGNIIDYILLVG